MEQSMPKKMDTFRTVSFDSRAPGFKDKLSTVSGYTVLEKHPFQEHYPNAIQLETPSGDVINLDFRENGTQAVVTHAMKQDLGDAVSAQEDELVLFANAVRAQYSGEIDDIVEMSDADRGI